MTRTEKNQARSGTGFVWATVDLPDPQAVLESLARTGPHVGRSGLELGPRRDLRRSDTEDTTSAARAGADEMISVSVLTAVVQKNRRMMSSRNAAVVIARKSTPEGGYPLFDHLAGAGDQRLRNFERERLSSLSLPAAPRLNFVDYRAA